ncbi:MAG: hypothetical protein ACI9Z3_002142 [Roseivirga sp.]|jgi:hypothetical protein
MSKEEFYIGYLPKAPKRIGRFAILASFFALVLLVFGAFNMISNQKIISNGTYEYGDLTELEGLLYSDPAPFLKVFQGKDINGNQIYKNILLINFGKFGAEESIRKIKAKSGGDLSKVWVKLRGTLIFHNGVTLMELTENENAYQSHRPLAQSISYQRNSTTLKTTSLFGEIIDPKCYFGSMKPGQGKPHQSCAALCIAGGIPPMFVVKNESGLAAYFLIKTKDKKALEKTILPNVAQPVTLSGSVEQVDDWNIFYINDN